MILLLDNYDSFVYNVAHALRAAGREVWVVRNDEISVEEVMERAPSHVILSPGPGTPASAGIAVPLVRAARGRCPVLGICLGHQAVGEAYGGSVVPARVPAHGRSSGIIHDGSGILSGLPSPFEAGRYHSLAVDASTLPSALRPVAWTEDGDLMAVWDESSDVWGVQFHPESILTPEGTRLLERFAALRSPVVRAVGSSFAALHS